MSVEPATHIAALSRGHQRLREENRKLTEQNERLLEQGRSLADRCRILANAESTLARVGADLDVARLRIVEQRNSLEAAEARADDSDKRAKEVACAFGLLEGQHTLMTQLVQMLWWSESKNAAKR
jgi:recombinational DNA repair ATPase RecF